MATSVAWAWLGDMEMDDALLGIGAAGVFQPGPPLAIGFLVNAAHCADQGSPMGASAMYREKRAFLDALFCGSFHAVLDGYASAGPARGWVGGLAAEQLSAPLGAACGLQDGLQGFLGSLAAASPQQLHLLISGPLLGRGREIFQGLAESLLAEEGVAQGRPRVILWMYAGSFNLAHSSEEDRLALRRFAEEHASTVTVVETTLKSGAWLCHPSAPFWGDSCPTAWSVEAAQANPIGFDISTDIQSVNIFLEGYSSQQPGTSSGRGLRWLFGRLAQDAADEGAAPENLRRLQQELEARSLVTNLMKMVNPDSSSFRGGENSMDIYTFEVPRGFLGSALGPPWRRLRRPSWCAPRSPGRGPITDSQEIRADLRTFMFMQLLLLLYMGKVREAIAVSQGELEKSFGRAKELAEGLTCTAPSAEALEAATVAAQAYAELYRGALGDFVEAGCAEFFPPEKPYSGPRLDKRCILRCMARGQLQGGPTADLLVLLALLLHAGSVGGSGAGADQGKDEACTMWSVLGACLPSSRTQQGGARPLPAATADLFVLRPGSASSSAWTAVLRPGTAMDGALKRNLAPLVDRAIDAMVLGAALLRAGGASGPAGAAPWGPRHAAWPA
ncbi:unnamed protein product [Prorocentrum cordatum]|uniref:Uncharacterized protein n=1 Tax=Prorocentrum cordatum TaxID=2364126 RepID=A0ABN9PJB1_9DINO|nr:unnamed protein product [Polarella glacialis]